MKNYIFNPINNKVPAGASAKGETITYQIKVSKFLFALGVNFCMHKDGFAENKLAMYKHSTDERYTTYELKVKFKDVGLYWYHFEVVYKDNIVKLIRSENLDIVESYGDSDYLQTIIESVSVIDPSFNKGIIYHIFVDRFNRSGEVLERDGLHLINDWNKPVEREFENNECVNKACYGGNLQGIIDKISYFKQLNVTTIYLSPIFEGNSSHKYDVADYSKIDSMFGDETKLKELIKVAKENKINIILDGVFNHTGSDSIYFNKDGRYRTIGAYQNKNSKYYDWYDFTNYPNEYSCWWGIKTLPQTNENSGFSDYIAGRGGILEKYMYMGIMGFRLDVVDELTNNFLRKICSAIKKVNKKAIVVGEVWEDASSKIAYDERKEYFLGGNLDSVTNYPMKNAILDFAKYGNIQGFVNTVNLIKDQYPKNIQNNLMTIIGSHDTVRPLTVLGINENTVNYSDREDYKLTQEEYTRGVQNLKIASLMQFTVMGIPTLFYGDEVGIQGTLDPFCRKPYPWGKENKEIFEWYKSLAKLRENPVFDGGELNIKYACDSLLIYERVKGYKKVIIAINKGGESQTFTLTKTMKDYISQKSVSGDIEIEPNGYKILIY